MRRQLAVLFLMGFLGCSQPGASDDISKIDGLINKIEKMGSSENLAEWNNIENEFNKINDHFQANRKNYSKEEIEKYNKAVGRYYATLFNNGISRFNEEIQDLQQQLEGATEGFKKALDESAEENGLN